MEWCGRIQRQRLSDEHAAVADVTSESKQLYTLRVQDRFYWSNGAGTRRALLLRRVIYLHIVVDENVRGNAADRRVPLMEYLSTVGDMIACRGLLGPTCV